MIKEELSDLDLIALIEAGSASAEAAFYERYLNYSKTIARSYVNEFAHSGIGVEDFTASAFSKVSIALANFNKIENKSVSFNGYWKTIVKNAIFDYLLENAYTSEVNRPLSDYSFDDYAYYNNERIELHDVIGEKDTYTSLRDVVINYIEEEDSNLSDDERLVAKLLLIDEYEVSEILQETGWGRPKLNYVIRNVRQKIGKILKDSYL